MRYYSGRHTGEAPLENAAIRPSVPVRKSTILTSQGFALISLRDMEVRSQESGVRRGNWGITEPACLRARLSNSTLIPQMLQSRDRDSRFGEQGSRVRSSNAAVGFAGQDGERVSPGQPITGTN
jgi:hypothetical protein